MSRAVSYDSRRADGKRELVLTEESKANLIELLGRHLDVDADPLPAAVAWQMLMAGFPPEVWADKVGFLRFKPDAQHQANLEGRRGAVQPEAILQDTSLQAMLVKTHYVPEACSRLGQLTRPVAAAEELLKWRITLEPDGQHEGHRDLTVYRVSIALHAGRHDEAVELAWDKAVQLPWDKSVWAPVVELPESSDLVAALRRLVQTKVQENVHDAQGLKNLEGPLDSLAQEADRKSNQPILKWLVAARTVVGTALEEEKASLAALTYRSIHLAAEMNDIEDVKRHLARDVHVDSRHEDKGRGYKGTTPLYWAARSGHPKMVEFLLDRDADPNALMGDGTPILSVLWHRRGADEKPLSDWLAVARLLLAHGADAKFSDEGGRTFLHRVVLSAEDDDRDIDYYLELAELFIEAGADVNARLKPNANDQLWLSTGGDTPLHILAKAVGGSTRIVQLLLKHGAAVNSTNDLGYTPLDYAVRASTLGGRSRDATELVQILRRAGGRPSGKKFGP